jgi:ectoine hydroxylase-related dioxygenase (phytanoyl-CoA dioxygenase family)
VIDLEAFRDEGWFVVPSLFSAAECDEIVGHVERAAFELALGEAADGPLSYRPMMHLASPALTAVATDPRWAPIVLALLGTGDARLYWEQAVSKPPQARTELPWHQDNGYTPLLPEEYVTCWLALDDADLDNGCLWVIPGSHHGGTVRHHNGGGPFRVGHDGAAEDGVPVPVPRGSVLVFSSLLMHRSGPNTTDRQRRAWIIQFCGASARSALSGRVLDDRLLCARDGEWLDAPVREREFDLLAVLANYDQR